MSDPFTEAWEEAEASKPPEVLLYHALELIHPAFVEDGVPFSVRAVAGISESINFTLEPGAPIDGGLSVEFKPIPFYAEFPEVSEGKTPSSKITVDNVARTVMPYLELAVRMRADMNAIYRQYRSDDLTAPCYGPIQFNVKQVKVTRTKVEGLAQIDDLANRKFPNKVYTINEFPGLRS